MALKEWEQRLKDLDQSNPKCNACDTDTHRCPGCGEPTDHEVRICTECIEFYAKGL